MDRSLARTIKRHVAVERRPRVMQLEGLFDVAPAERAEQTWNVNLTLPEKWNIGLIVGPSGAGKSTVARELWSDHIASGHKWPKDKSILDGFPAGMSIKDITGLLSSVGFSSPPAWMKPYRVLSNGEQFRVDMARTLAEHPDLAVVDEFTSVVDRDVAKIASAAIAKAVRRRKQQLVAVTCHYDVAEWLEPDWVYQPHTGAFVAGRLLRRPAIELEIVRAHRQAWELFKTHHYLDHGIHRCANTFVAIHRDRPVAFMAVLHMPLANETRGGYREHRMVCLPDFQGVGIGNAISEYVASLYVTRKPYYSVTSSPAMIYHRARSPFWHMHRHPSRVSSFNANVPGLNATISSSRFTAGFRYVGPSRPDDAKAFGIM